MAVAGKSNVSNRRSRRGRRPKRGSGAAKKVNTRASRPRTVKSGQPPVNWALRIATLVIAGVFIWYGGLAVRRVISSRFIRTAFAETGRVILTYDCEALIVWEKETVSAPASGKLKLLVREGEKVRVGQPLFTVINPDLEGELRARLKEKNEERESFIAKYETETADLEASLATAKSSLAKATDDLKKALRAQDEMAVRRARGALETCFKEHDEIEGKIKAIEKELARLVKEEQEIKDMLASSERVVPSSKAGTVTFFLDDPTFDISIDDLNGIRPDKIFGVNDKKRRIETGEGIRGGDPVCEVFDDSKAYLVLPVKEDLCRELLKKGQVELDLNEDVQNSRITAECKFMGGISANGYVSIVVEAREGLQGLLEHNVIDVSVVTASYEGVTVPVSALCIRDGKQGVFVIEKAAAVFKQVEVKGQNDEQAAVIGIEAGSEVVLTPRMVQDRREVHQ
jgi:putative membrane fusion protein